MTATGSGTSSLHLLIDYDNVTDFARGMSLAALVKHIETKISSAHICSYDRLNVRLYGGWNWERGITRSAQTLAAEIQRSFPAPIARVDEIGRTVHRITTVELATSPLTLPNVILKGTLMSDRTVRKIRCTSRPWVKCSNDGDCGLRAVERFLAEDACPTHSCHVTPLDVLRRTEQKQVDTLIVADLCELALRRSAVHVVLVSSDADMWPGVLMCLSAGCTVVHVNRQPGYITPPHLKSGLGRLAPQYFETSV